MNPFSKLSVITHFIDEESEVQRSVVVEKGHMAVNDGSKISAMKQAIVYYPSLTPILILV